MERLKAARLHEYNKPLRIEDVDYPRLEGRFDVIVRIAGAGVCHTDLHLVQGMWHELLQPKLPYTLGHENVGYIEEVAEGVEGLEKGDPVILHPAVTDGTCLACRAGEDMHCENLEFPGLNIDGGFAEFMRTSHRSVIKLPKDISREKLVEMAPLADAGITAYRAVKKAARTLYPGAYVAIVGVGGLGHIAVQLLKVMTPATVIALDVKEEKLKLAERLGADHVVDARRDPVKQVMELTRGRGVNVAMDFVGSQATVDYTPYLLGRMGRLIIVGYGGELRFPTIRVISSEVSFEGSLVGNYVELHELVTLALQGKVRVEVDIHKLDEINDVLERLEKGEVLGRAVLIP
ncbi:NAD(P)-dependent alcohol dehydrogenase [Aeropyrum pernix]|uniref:NAD(P)-dependent alcohol dehydrogenase n=1 Tax=Aeropyrum pernix TaxID=56636 RepID=UPI003898F8BA